jgi:predicted membrane protein
MNPADLLEEIEDWLEPRKRELRYILLLVAVLLALAGKMSSVILWSLSASLFWASLFLERIQFRFFLLSFLVFFGVHLFVGEDFISKSNQVAVLVTCVTELYKAVESRRSGGKIE